MSQRSCSLLAALALLAALSCPLRAASTAGADDSSVVAAAGQLLDAAERSLIGLEAVEPQEAGPFCSTALRLDALMDRTRRKGFPAVLASSEDFAIQYSYRYYTCRALAEQDQGACAALEPINDLAQPHPRLECERYSRELLFARSLILRSPDVRSRCMAALTHPEDDEFKPADRPRACELTIAGYRQPQRTCDRLEPIFLKKHQTPKCVAWMSGLAGNRQGCMAMPPIDVRERCLAYADFQAARAAGDAARCGKEPLCRVLMGEGASACQAYADLIQANACRPLRRQWAGDKVKIAGLIAKARALLSRAAGASGAPAQLKTADALERRYDEIARDFASL